MKTFSLKQFTSRLAHIAKTMRPTLLRGAMAGATKSLDTLKLATVTHGAYASGDFLRGWRARQSSDGVYVGNISPHSFWVENGRRPGRFPPIIVIQRWVEMKLQVAGPEARRAAFLIARQIARAGTKGRFILKNHQPLIQKLIQEGMLKAFQEEMKK